MGRMKDERPSNKCKMFQLMHRKRCFQGNANWMTAMVLFLVMAGILPSRVDGFSSIPIIKASTILKKKSTTQIPATLEVGEAIASFYLEQPYLSAFLTCSVKAGTADAIVQTKALTKFDQARNLAFICYGGIYQGVVQQYIFGTVYPELFGTDGSWQSIAMQVGTEMTLLAPFLCLPLAYVATTLFEENNELIPLRSNKPTDALLLQHIPPIFHRAMDRYKSDVQSKQLLLKYWALWVPVNSITFGVIPIHFRVAFIACISFLWVMVLSSISSSDMRRDEA